MSITGTGTLTVAQTSSRQTFSGMNTYSGGTILNGELVVGDGDNVGTPWVRGP